MARALRRDARRRVRFVDAAAGPDRAGDRPRLVQVLKHGNLYLLTDPFGDIHPDSRGLGPVPRRHADPVVLDPPRQRRAAGAAPGSTRRQLPGHDPADQPELDRNLDDKVAPAR